MMAQLGPMKARNSNNKGGGMAREKKVTEGQGMAR